MLTSSLPPINSIIDLGNKSTAQFDLTPHLHVAMYIRLRQPALLFLEAGDTQAPFRHQYAPKYPGGETRCLDLESAQGERMAAPEILFAVLRMIMVRHEPDGRIRVDGVILGADHNDMSVILLAMIFNWC